MIFTLDALSEEIIIYIFQFIEYKERYKLLVLNKYFNNLLKSDLFITLNENDFNQDPFTNGNKLLNIIIKSKPYTTLIIPPEKYYINYRNFIFDQSINIVSKMKYANITLSSFITFNENCNFGLKNIDFKIDNTFSYNNCCIFINNCYFHMSYCRLFCNLSKCINSIKSNVYIGNTIFSGRRIINGYKSNLYIIQNDFIDTDEAIYTDSCTNYLKLNFLKNISKNAFSCYKGKSYIINNIINNSKKNGIKLIEQRDCILKFNKIKNSSKNGIYIIENSNTEILDNNILSNERCGIRIFNIHKDGKLNIINNHISFNVSNGIFSIGCDINIFNNHIYHNLNSGIYGIGISSKMDYNYIKSDGCPCIFLKKSSFTLSDNKLLINNYDNEVMIN